jgi:hypothetical protein
MYLLLDIRTRSSLFFLCFLQMSYFTCTVEYSTIDIEIRVVDEMPSKSHTGGGDVYHIFI